MEKTFRDPEIEPFTRSKFDKYSLAGIINGPILKIPIPQKLLCLIRVPIITPNYTQLILEISCKNFENEPKFAPSWEELQMIIVFDCNYRGVTEQIASRRAHIFSLNWSRQTFIWLSPRGFWINPIAKPDPNQPLSLSFTRCGKGEGFLRYSIGSRFGPFWHDNFDIHSTKDLNPYQLSDFEEFHVQYHRSHLFSKLVNQAKKSTKKSPTNFPRSSPFYK
jgi:hypothetical protein